MVSGLIRRSSSRPGPTLRRGFVVVAAAVLAASAWAPAGAAQTTASTAAPAATAVSGPIQAVADDGTRDVDFNDWQFKLATRGNTGPGPTGNPMIDDTPEMPTADVIDPAYDTSDWRRLTVPHDWSVEGPKVATGTSSHGYLEGGLGWYRKAFTVPQSMKDAGKRISVDFEGCFQDCSVYLNGELAGTYPHGYTGFAFDLTDRLNYGPDSPNVLVVRAQNRVPATRWYNGSGLTRPVHLIVTDATRFARHGVVLTAPDLASTYVADRHAQLGVKATVLTERADGEVWLTTSVIDARGNVVGAKTSVPVPAAAGSEVTATDTLQLAKVHLWYPWNLGDPYLYTVRTQLNYRASGDTSAAVVDSIDTSYGFRWLEFKGGATTTDPNGGAFVNGRYTKFRGANLHHDVSGLGGISNPDAYEWQWRLMMGAGINAYRTGHATPSREELEVTDRLGILVMDEAYDGWGQRKATFDFGFSFLTTMPPDWPGIAPNTGAEPAPPVDYTGAQYTWSDWVLQEQVRRDINSASVVMWSIGNEVSGVGTRPSWYDGTKYNPLGLARVTPSTFDVYTEATRLKAAVDAIDTTRPVTVGDNHQKGDYEFTPAWLDVDRVLDGVGWNYEPDDGMDWVTQQIGAGTFFFESESGSSYSGRGVYFNPQIMNTGTDQTPGQRGTSSYDNGGSDQRGETIIKKDRDRRSFLGQFMWSGMDYIGEPAPYNAFPVGVSGFGMLDTAGFPKDSFYMFQSQWVPRSVKPMTHIVPMDWTRWREGENVPVWVYSNARTTELFLNGHSLGTKSFDVKKTHYGAEYYETSELVADSRRTRNDPEGNCNSSYPAGMAGYASPPGTTVVDASGDSAIPGGALCGRLHLTWDVPFEQGELTAKSYTDASKAHLVAEDTIATAGPAYTLRLTSNKSTVKADGRALSFISVQVVDRAGNVVPQARNLVKFDVTGGAIVGVDNGAQDSDELYKWGGIERNTHSERSAYNGKALVIVQSNRGELGNIVLTASSDGLRPAQAAVAVTSDGQPVNGQPVIPQHVQGKLVGVNPVAYTTPAGIVPTLPRTVRATYSDETVGSYELELPVTWQLPAADAFAAPGELDVTGTAQGAGKVSAHVSVLPASSGQDISTNTALGNNNRTWRWSDVPADSPLRSGALATASFTAGGAPNNVINGNPAQRWDNAWTKPSTRTLTAYANSDPYDWLQFFWDQNKAMDEVDLTFDTATLSASGGAPPLGIPARTINPPASIDVTYWDGLTWVPVSGLTVTPPADAGQPTKVTFEPVFTPKLRVGLTNGTPLSPTSGFMRVPTAVVRGWVLGAE